MAHGLKSRAPLVGFLGAVKTGGERFSHRTEPRHLIVPRLATLLAKVFENCRDVYLQLDILAMSEEAHHLVELALGTVEALMSSKNQPKVILFDIGGVCVSFSCHIKPRLPSPSLSDISVSECPTWAYTEERYGLVIDASLWPKTDTARVQSLNKTNVPRSFLRSKKS